MVWQNAAPVFAAGAFIPGGARFSVLGMSSIPVRRPLGSTWLLRLRWLAVIGQVVTCVVATVWLGAKLPLGVLAACLLVTAGTNLWVGRMVARSGRMGTGLAWSLVWLDIVTLTVMLYWTGGAQNPFTAFYLLHITIAAILLPPAGAWGSVVLAMAGYGLLFVSPHELVSESGGTCCETHSAHLQGMLLALGLAGGLITFFVGKLSAELVRREAELAEARMQAVREERFASLATLAAGVAHELATPLGTIAVVAKEIEIAQRGAAGDFPEMRVIRAEVERCRAVLERMGARASQGPGEGMATLRVGEVPGRLRDYVSPDVWSRVDFELGKGGRFRVPLEPFLQSLAVLLKNGVEASGRDGRVALRAGEEGGEVIFEVRDAGEGMSVEVRKRAGEPFFTTKEPGRGMGLGLFLVRMFVERVRGRLLVESTPGQGSVVRLVVPGASEAAG